MTHHIEITSAANPRYKTLLKLADGRGVRKNNLTIVSGLKILTELLESPDIAVQDILFTESMYEGESFESFWQLIGKRDLKVSQKLCLSPGLFAELDVFGTHAPLLVVTPPAIAAFDDASDRPEEYATSLVLPVQNPDNLGAIVRSAVAFGVQRIILTPDAAHPFHIKSIRSSAGAVFKAKFELTTNLVNDLKSPSLGQLYVLDGAGTDIRQCEFAHRSTLICGSEGQGICYLPESIHPEKLRIEMSEQVESLNAAVAVSIALFEACGRPR